MEWTPPAAWTFARSEVSFELFDDAPLQAPLARVKAPARPSAMISVVRSRSAARTAAAAAREAVAELARFAPQLRKEAERAVRFADGASGAAVRVSFEPAPGARACQLHVFRLDGGALTHATATVEAHGARKLDEIETLLLSISA